MNKERCDCRTCEFQRRERETWGFTGWHIITLTHGPGTDSATCRCGWAHTDWPGECGPAIAEHRLGNLPEFMPS